MKEPIGSASSPSPMRTSSPNAASPPVELFDSASPMMRRLFRMLADVAVQNVPVLLRGESGTGKSMFARALHGASARRTRPFVAVYCPALTASLPSSARGGQPIDRDRAAVRALRARVAAADGGTILMDEVAALSAHSQVETLRLLDEVPRAAKAHGARIIASTQRDLEGAVESGEFRKDLFFRLDVVELSIPPLRDRRDDILSIARYYLDHFAQAEGLPSPQIAARAEQALLAYKWPGNIRELRNAMQRATILARDRALDLDVLPERLAAGL